MIELRNLIYVTFLGGACFDSFMSSLVRESLLSAFIFIALTIVFMNKAIKLYDQIKVK